MQYPEVSVSDFASKFTKLTDGRWKAQGHGKATQERLQSS